MKQEALVTSFIVERMGDMRHFQILLPRDTKRIIGLEHSVNEKYEEPFVPLAPVEDPFLFVSNKVIGSIVLRANGCEGIFYQGDLVEDSNIHFGEAVAPDFAMPWSHERKRHEIELNVKENRIVYGFFKDCLGTGVNTYVYYRLNLYLWIEKCEQ